MLKLDHQSKATKWSNAWENIGHLKIILDIRKIFFEDHYTGNRKCEVSITGAFFLSFVFCALHIYSMQNEKKILFRFLFMIVCSNRNRTVLKFWLKEKLMNYLAIYMYQNLFSIYITMYFQTWIFMYFWFWDVLNGMALR